MQGLGFSPDKLYYLKEGNVSVKVAEKEILILEKGDLLNNQSVQNIIGSGLHFGVKPGVSVESISLEQLYTFLNKNSDQINQWFAIMSLIQVQLYQVISALTKKEKRAKPGFNRYKAGMEIIKEGDEADYVYSINDGTAVAVHNGIEVGEIKKDEIFGAIAVLTNQKRTASVLAKTNCTVLMVHKDEFSQLVRTHPNLFLNILSSLAEKITSLNKKVSSSD